MPAHTCVVLADAARARFIEADAKLAELTEVEDFIHPASRERTREIVTDRKGSTRGGPGMSKSGTEGPDAQRTEQENFARIVARRIDRMRDDYGRIILAAPPRFLGMLRAELDANTAKSVKTINQNYTRLAVHEIPGALRKHVH